MYTRVDAEFSGPRLRGTGDPMQTGSTVCGGESV